jgi:hypothetical protein
MEQLAAQAFKGQLHGHCQRQYMTMVLPITLVQQLLFKAVIITGQETHLTPDTLQHPDQ